MVTVSRKRFQEALRVLKTICKDARTPLPLKLRAVELLMTIYGLELPDSSYKVKRAAKDLVAESRFDRALRKQLDQSTRADAIQAARAFLDRVGANEEHEQDVKEVREGEEK